MSPNNRATVFQVANRLHYQGGLPRHSALRHAWSLCRQAEPQYSKVRGVSHEQRQQVLSRLFITGLTQVSAFLFREPNNPTDPNAIAIILTHRPSGRMFHMGYVAADRASRLAPLMDAGLKIEVELTGITGGPRAGDSTPRSYGLNFAYRFAGVA